MLLGILRYGGIEKSLVAVKRGFAERFRFADPHWVIRLQIDLSDAGVILHEGNDRGIMRGVGIDFGNQGASENDLGMILLQKRQILQNGAVGNARILPMKRIVTDLPIEQEEVCERHEALHDLGSTPAAGFHAGVKSLPLAGGEERFGKIGLRRRLSTG